MNPIKALPYAVGGLLGGTLLKSAFGKKKKSPGVVVNNNMGTATTVPAGPSPSSPYAGA